MGLGDDAAGARGRLYNLAYPRHEKGPPVIWNEVDTRTLGEDDEAKPPEEAAKPPEFAAGICSFHLNESQSCGPDESNLFGSVVMFDNHGAIIGETARKDDQPYGSPMNHGESYFFDSELGKPLIITGEHRGDYVQFEFDGRGWTNKDESGEAKCDTGGWHAKRGPYCFGVEVPSVSSWAKL